MHEILAPEAIPLRREHIEVLRGLGEPQWFGLGFIQLKVSPTIRFHFWHPELNPDGYVVKFPPSLAR